MPASPQQLVDHQNLLSDIHTQFQAWVSKDEESVINVCVVKGEAAAWRPSEAQR